MSTLTVDDLALRIILSSRSEAEQTAQLQALRTTVAHMVGGRCPKCESPAIEDNGRAGRQASFRCTDCDHGWDAAY